MELNNTNTEELFNNVQTQLETIQTTQPNVYKLWKVYLYKKEKDFIDSLKECMEMLHSINSIQHQLSISDLQTLFMMKKLTQSNALQSNALQSNATQTNYTNNHLNIR